MHTVTIALREFAPEHLDAALALSCAAGWPHRREDWAFILSLSTGLVLLDRERVIGTALATPFGDDTAMINMVLVDERWRGRGLGRQLMTAALQVVGGRECRLTATEVGLPLYRALGFHPVGTVTQHQGHAVLTDGEPDGITWENRAEASILANLDREACGMDRKVLIGRLVAAGRVAITSRDGNIAGFAVLRRFGRGEVIGPVVAKTTEDARALLAFIIAARRGNFLRVDTSNGTELGSWLSECGLVGVDTGTLMRRGGHGQQRATSSRTFALASQALG